MAIVNTILGALPGANVFRGKALDIGLGWISLTVALNIILTSMICTRIILARRKIGEVLTPELGAMYSSVLAIVVESAVPLTLVGIGLLVVSVLQNDTESAWAFVWAVFTVRFLLMKIT